MSAVVEAIGGAVSDVVEFVGDVGETVVQAAGDVVETVGDVAQNVVQGAVDDPLGTIAKVGTAIYAPYLLPVVTAADVVAKGGDIEDALIAGAVSYVAPEVGNFVAGEVAGSALGEALGQAAEATGIEALPQVAARGIGQAAVQTGIGLARGQDIGDALTRGLTAGVGSTVGGIAGSEADTGSNIADRLIGQTVSGATTAALRGKDAEVGAGTSLANALLGEGIRGLQNEYNAPSEPKTTAEALPTSTESVAAKPMLADTGATMTDAALSPTEEVIRQMTGKVTVYDPVTGEPVVQQETPEEKANLQAFIEALYPETKAKEVTRIDDEGKAYDAAGQIIGDASEFGLTKGTDTTGNAAWVTPAGELIASSPSAPEPTSAVSPDATALDVSSLLGDQAGDYPEKIINNPDGSTTVIESDGTQRIFNVDGSVTLINADGTTTEEFGAKQEETPSETSSSDSSLNLGNLANALLGGVTNVGSSIKRTASGVPLGAIAGLGAGIAAGIDAANAPTQQSGMGAISPYGFNWQTGEYQSPVNAVAYGQEFVRPEYTMTAANGGLMSVAPQYITPTVPNNGLSMNTDPSSSVQMYAHGGLSSLGHYSDGGRMLKGPGDGMSDDIPAVIAGKQPARLANEEFVIPADVVSHLGNGSSEAGAKVLYDMMAKIRKARTGTSRQGKQINPHKYLPK